MNILLATYNFYPYHWGGSEYYVLSEAKYLKSKGYNVYILASMPEEAFEKYSSLFDDENLKVIHYQYEDFTVLGAQIKGSNTFDIYSRYNKKWDRSWIDFFQKQELSFDIIHFHANTLVISRSILYASREINTKIKSVFSYHVPQSCPIGILVRNSKKECNIKPNIFECSACLLNYHKKVPPILAKLAFPFSYFIGIPKNISAFIENCEQLYKEVDKVITFSNQISSIIKKINPDRNNIYVERHGIDPVFFSKIKIQKQNEKQIFLFAGRFVKEKGFNILHKAWSKLKQKENRELWLIGGDLKVLNKNYKTLFERSDVKSFGKLNSVELYEKYLEAHCVIIPSIWIEIGPLVFHEALACKANVIASDIGGNKELSDFYKTGCTTYKFNSPHDLHKKISEFKYTPVNHIVKNQNEHLTKIFEIIND